MDILEFESLERDIATWETLVKVDDETGYLVNDYFDIATYAALKERCPNSIQTRGHPFHTSRTLSDVVLNDFLTQLSNGLTKLTESNDEERTQILLEHIKARSTTVFDAMSELRQEMTDPQLLQSLSTFVTVQLWELKILSLRFLNWTGYLKVYHKTLDDIDHLKRLLSIATESSAGMIEDIDSHLEGISELVELIEHKVGKLLEDDHLYTGFSMNLSEPFTHQSVEQTLTCEGRTFPDLCLLGFKRRQGGLRSSLVPELKTIHLDVKTRVSIWKGKHVQNLTNIITPPIVSATVAQPAMSAASTVPADIARNATTVTPSTSGTLSTLAPPQHNTIPSISRSQSVVSNHNMGGNMFEAFTRLPDVYQSSGQRRGNNFIFDNVTSRDRLNRSWNNSGRTRSPEVNREVNRDNIKISKFYDKM